MIPRYLQLKGETYPNVISSNTRMEEEKEYSSQQAQNDGDTEYNNLRIDKNQRKFIQADCKDDEKYDMDFLQKDGISFTGDVLSFQEKEGSVDSWQDNDFTFFGSEPSPLYNGSPIMERIQVDPKAKDVEVIEVLSEYSEGKSSDPLDEGKSLSQLLAKDKRDTSAGKNNETESGSPIDELINFWNQNSSKSTMLFQYEPLQVEANNKKENKAKIKSNSVPKSDGLSCDVTKNHQFRNDKVSKRKCNSEDKKKRSVFSRIYNRTATDTRKKSKHKEKTNNEYKQRLFQRSGKLMQYKISKKNFMEKLRDKQREKDKNAEILIEDPLNDESSYIMLGDKFGIMIECYSQESGFADIQEVLERKKDFAVDGKDSDCIDEIDHIIYPNKPHIRIGKKYQAILPKLTKKSPSQRVLCKVWDAGRIEIEQYEDYIDMLSELTEVMQSSMNEEKAVETLIYNDYSVDKALKFVRANLCYVSDYIESKGLSIK